MKLLPDTAALTGLRRYAVNSTWLLTEQALRLVAGVAVGTWVARHLGPAQYGSLAYYLSFVAMFAAFARVGLDVVGVRQLVADPEGGMRILGTLFRMKLLGSAVTVVLIALAAAVATERFSDAVFITVIASALFFQTLDVIDFWFQARHEARVPALCRLVQLSLSSIAKIALILAGAEIGTFVAVAVFDQLVLAASLWGAFRLRRPGEFVRKFDPALARRMLQQSAPLIFSGLLIAAYMRFDQVLLRHLAGTDVVGWYAAAVVISEALYSFPIAIATAVFPAMVSAYDCDINRYRERVAALGRVLIAGGIVLAALISAAAPAIIDLLYGSAYLPSIRALQIHVWTLPFICYSAALGKTLVTEGRTRVLPRLTVLAAATNAVALFVLIPSWGLVGAAMAAVLAQGLPVIVMLAVDRGARRDFVAMLAPFVVERKQST